MNTNGNTNTFPPFGGQNSNISNPNLQHPPPNFYNSGPFYGHSVPASPAPGVTGYLPTPTLFNVLPTVQHISGSASSPLQQTGFYSQSNYDSSMLYQRESYASPGCGPGLPGQTGLSLQRKVPPPSTIVSGAFALEQQRELSLLGQSASHENISNSMLKLSSTSALQTMGSSVSLPGDSSLSVLNIPATSQQIEPLLMKQSDPPLPKHSDALGQSSPSVLRQSEIRLQNIPLLSGFGESNIARQTEPFRTQQGNPPLFTYGSHMLQNQSETLSLGHHLSSVSLSSDSQQPVPEVPVTAQKMKSSVLQQSCPPLPRQSELPLPMQNVPIASSHSSPLPGHNAFPQWQSDSSSTIQTTASALVKTSSSLPVYNGAAHSVQGTLSLQYETSQPVSDPNQAYKTIHPGPSSSSTECSLPIFVPPYPPPPVPGHTSSYSMEMHLQHNFSKYINVGPDKSFWFGNMQSSTVSQTSIRSSVQGPAVYPGSSSATLSEAHSKIAAQGEAERTKAEKNQEKGTINESRPWVHSSSTNRTKSHGVTKDRRSGREYERSNHRSSSPKSGSVKSRSRRDESSPRRSHRWSRHTESQHFSRHHKHHSSRATGRSSDRRRHSRSSSLELSSSHKYHEVRKNVASAESKVKKREEMKEDGALTRNTSAAQKHNISHEGHQQQEVEQVDGSKNDCSADRNEIHCKLEELAQLKPEEIIEREKTVWTRSSPSDLYYVRDENNPKIMKGTLKLTILCNRIFHELVKRSERVRTSRPAYDPPPRKNRMKLAKHKSEVQNSSDSSSVESSTDEESCTMEELERKRLHPYRLHQEMWFNDPGEMNDGPLCRCSAKARRYGIRHGIYAGEKHLEKCDPNSNNGDRLFHYRIMISPPTNFLTKMPTVIKHDEHEFIFEGFSMFAHVPLDKLPTCKVIRFNIEYTILYIEEKFPENFTVWELDLFYEYLFREILELVDLDFNAHEDEAGCSQFHFMPRFVRDLQDNGREILSMNEIMLYLLANSKPLIEEKDLPQLLQMPQFRWQNFADEVKGMVVTHPGMKPCSVRVDQLDRDQPKGGESNYPEIVHFGIRPPQLSYAGNPDYQKAWREYVKFRHLLANMSKPSYEDKRKLEAKEIKLQDMRTQTKMKRDVTVAVSAKGFYRTGIMCDIVQHAMLIPVLVCHLRFHRSCDTLEKEIGYKFKNRFLLQLALTHPSYRENFGTNPDHARNSLTNCGIRQPEYGDRRIHYLNTRKRGINTLINIMSRFGKKTETESNITHNERLEFLGDAVVEFLSSIHLFHMFPDLEEGGLATYRAAIVQNQHLAVLAKYLNLEAYMLYAHGSDLCHDLELRHAMANCFEALMGALFLDGGIEAADKVFGETLFKNNSAILGVWLDYPPHPLQQQEPEGDRKWIPAFDFLQDLTQFEEDTGIQFKHIRLLARAFTDRSIGYTNLTLGSNQRLEFLGDTVLQLIASEYLYKHFPEHHEGHLSLLRSSLVNNRTQAVVCDDLGMTHYAVYANPKVELKTKDRADLLEAFLGALYVDQGMLHCQAFCNVCFFPRLQQFIMNQDWNDPKSKLQQCCLTLRTMDGREPDIPVYKVIECKGPTNTRVYTVAVYFRGSRLAKASGHSIQQAEMNAAKKALEMSHGLFPQLDHQKRVIAKSLWKQRRPKYSSRRSSSRDCQRESDTENEEMTETQKVTSAIKHAIQRRKTEMRPKEILSPSRKIELRCKEILSPGRKTEVHSNEILSPGEKSDHTHVSNDSSLSNQDIITKSKKKRKRKQKQKEVLETVDLSFLQCIISYQKKNEESVITEHNALDHKKQ